MIILGTLSTAEIEALGLALMRLEQTVREMAAQFDLGPLGRLL